MKKLTTVLVLIFSSGVFAGEHDALHKLLNPIDSLEAKFSQTVYGSNNSVTQCASGIISIKKPDMFKWQIEEPDPNIVISNGKTLWNYDIILEQVTVEPFDSSEEVSPISFLFEDPEENFIVEEISPVEYSLTPKKENPNFRFLELEFKDGKISKLRMFDHLDQVTYVEFHHVINNPEIKDNMFNFVPPPGVDVIGSPV